jgi:Tfp pilus assembly PilM family ATPase
MVDLKRNSLQINHYSIHPLEKDLVSEGVINNIEQVSATVREQWDKLSSDSRHVAISIPYNSVIIKEIRVPNYKSQHRLDDFVLEYLIKELDTDDIDFDYTIINSNSEELTLSVVVAKKEKIEEYLAIIQMTDMNIAAIDVEPFAIQYLFEILFKNKTMLAPSLILDLGATRIRAYILQEHKLVLFSEISVNYYTVLEELALTTTQSVNVNKVGSIDECLFNLSDMNSLNFTKLAENILYDVLVERKINLADNVDLYLMGGNAVIPGVVDRLNQVYAGNVYLATELLVKENPHIPTKDLMRLLTAISLATWGNK